MTDLHTHILPYMDDGAQNTAQSIEMLRLSWGQGVRTLALTPHYYPEQESVEAFLRRRTAAYDALKRALGLLPQAERESLPRLVLGAETAWVSGLADLPGVEKLCYEGSRYLLVELPFAPWSDRLFGELNDLMNRTALTPVIAHADRYFKLQSRRRMEELCALGLPIQLSAAAAERFLSRERALRMLRRGSAQLLISDCHNMAARRPNLAAAYDTLALRLGAEAAKETERCSDMLLEK